MVLCGHSKRPDHDCICYFNPRRARNDNLVFHQRSSDLLVCKTVSASALDYVNPSETRCLNVSMSPDEVLLFFLMMISGWLLPCHEGAADCRPERFLLSVSSCTSSLAHLHASSLLQFFFSESRYKWFPASYSFCMVA